MYVQKFGQRVGDDMKNEREYSTMYIQTEQEAHGPWCSQLENQLGHLPKLHIYSLSNLGIKTELIFTLWAAVSQIWADFRNGHIWAWNLVIDQSARSCTYSLFLTQGVKIELIFALWAVRDTGRFSKLQYLGIKTWPLAKVPEVAHMVCF